MEHSPIVIKSHDSLDKALIALAAIYNLTCLFVAIFWLFTNRFADYKSKLGMIPTIEVNENVTYAIFMAGLLGGAFYCLRAIYSRLADAYTPIDKQAEVDDVNGGKKIVKVKEEVSPSDVFNIKAWIFWYIFRPIQGGVLALIILALADSKLITLETENFKDADLTNFFVLIGVGFLCGLGSHEVMLKIQELIQVLFAKSNSKFKSSEERARENKGVT